MGDGHHGWVSAEILLAAADMFGFEYHNEIYLLSGIPLEWFAEGKSFSIEKLKLKAGQVSLSCSSSADEVRLNILFEENRFYRANKFIIKFPLKLKPERIDDVKMSYKNDETIVEGKFNSVALNLSKTKE